MEFDDIRAFVAVADTGSLMQAGRDLHITQPAVTRRLQRLEKSLGARLLDRGTRPVSLTGAGQATLERCKRLLNDVREIRASATNGKLPRGEIRIGVAHALTELTLTEPADKVRRLFPDVALLLHTGWSRDLLERVRSGNLGLAVILLPKGQQLPADVFGKNVGSDRLVLVAPRQIGTPPPRSMKDLVGAQWVLNPEGCAARAALRRALLQADIDMVVAVEAFDYNLQLDLVARNRALTLVPKRILDRSPLRTRLRVSRIPELDFPLTTWVVYRRQFTELASIASELGSVLRKRA